MIGRVLLFAATIVACATAAFAAPRVLQPANPWVLDYAEAQCIAYRQYASGNGLLTLAITPSPNLGTYELTIIKDHPGSFYAEEMEGSVDFGTKPIAAWLLSYGHAKKDIERYRISAAEMQEGRGAPFVKFRSSVGDFTFALDNMPALLDGLRDCIENLRKYWNFSEQDSAGPSIKARGDLRTIFSASDFPPQALARRQEGTSQFLLLIDEKGNVAACHILRTSGVPVFDAMGCGVIVERAKFIPARDAQGKPVRSAVATPPITWRIGF